MRIILSTFIITLLSISLSACDGLNVDSTNPTDDNSTDQRFTRAELTTNVIFSSSLLSDNGLNSNRDGFIVLFNSSAELDEIELAENDNDVALFGSYTWDINDDDLVVTYPNGAVCDTSKTSETSTVYETNARCEGGEPNNARIENTINRSLLLEEENFEGLSIVIDNEDNSNNDQRIDFLSNGTAELRELDDDGDEIAASLETATFQDSAIFNNAIALENANSGFFSLFVLMQGTLNSGTMLEVKYTDSTLLALQEVRIYEIGDNNLWETDSLYDEINVDP